MESFDQQLAYHKILEKLEVLHTLAQNRTWTNEQTIQYKRLDDLLMESMLYAEKSSKKVASKRYEWSPVLAQAIHTLRFWELSRKRSIGLKIPDRTLQIKAQKGEIDLQLLPSPLTYSSIMTYQKQAQSNLK
jgi:hypothetical protein